MNRMQRRELKKLKQEIKTQLKNNPKIKLPRRKDSKRSKLLGSMVITLLIWFFWPQCSVESPKPSEILIEQPKAKQLPKPPPLSPEKQNFRPAPVKPKARPKLETPPLSQPAWLYEFQLQVSTRSPDLAQCANGASEPGVIRWSALLDPISGTVADQRLESVGATEDIGTQRMECLKSVLRAKPYQLKPQGDMSPRRVMLILEY